MNDPQTTAIDLDVPIVRGDTTIERIELRRPKAGELRGVKLADVLQMDVAALTTIIPRISQPTLTEAEVANLDPADFTQMGGAIAGFLLPRSALAGPLSLPA